MRFVKSVRIKHNLKSMECLHHFLHLILLILLVSSNCLLISITMFWFNLFKSVVIININETIPTISKDSLFVLKNSLFEYVLKFISISPFWWMKHCSFFTAILVYLMRQFIYLKNNFFEYLRRFIPRKKRYKQKPSCKIIETSFEKKHFLHLLYDLSREIQTLKTEKNALPKIIRVQTEIITKNFVYFSKIHIFHTFHRKVILLLQDSFL